MIFVFYLFGALLIFLSFRSLRGGIDYLNYFKKELAKPVPHFAPVVAVIAPCKGLDAGLKENLTALLEQDYPNYEVLFIVDDKEDSAVGVLEEVSREAAKYAKKTKLIVAPKATESGQKVENLREAVLHISEGAEIIAFVDSDVRTAKDWLFNLVAPLEDATIGATTGYRWFISEKPTFASELRSAWNASIASAFGPNTKENFCWGGSMAIRRDAFEELQIREKWRGTLSDDLTVTHAMLDANLSIHFVPGALTPSIGDCTFREMLEFTTRQMKVTRVYAPKLWLVSFLGSGLFCLVMTTALLITMAGPQNGIEIFIAIATLFTVSVLSISKSWVRLNAVRLVLTDHDEALRKQILPQLTLWIISPFIFLYNCVAAVVSRRLVWRGTEYELLSNTETRIIKPISHQ